MKKKSIIENGVQEIEEIMKIIKLSILLLDKKLQTALDYLV